MAIRDFRTALDTYRFDIAAGVLYEFIWNQFCDWYLELTKPVLTKGSEAEQRAARHTLVNVLETLLRLAHPIIPFITETIWKSVAPLAGVHADTIMIQAFPEFDAAKVDEAAMADQEWVKEFIVSIRNIRAEMNVAPSVPSMCCSSAMPGCPARSRQRGLPQVAGPSGIHPRTGGR